MWHGAAGHGTSCLPCVSENNAPQLFYNVYFRIDARPIDTHFFVTLQPHLVLKPAIDTVGIGHTGCRPIVYQSKLTC